jgi:ABC-type lipopolysaccharide export system ATPase subunit
VEKKHNESSKIFADFTLSRIQPEIRQSFTDVQHSTVLAQGTPADIVDNADVRRVYLGEHFRM